MLDYDLNVISTKKQLKLETVFMKRMRCKSLISRAKVLLLNKYFLINPFLDMDSRDLFNSVA